VRRADFSIQQFPAEAFNHTRDPTNYGWPNPRGGPAIPANLVTFSLLTPEYVTAVALDEFGDTCNTKAYA
jgi:hypothetical protein